ncbi:16S rRNA (cytosine(1402)-N(4))-methyltransferase RsmH [Kosmotoga pacifica]|uniref:Ribosomal RNA small subunit methyltransferase H n=1 Tax=Kosmotoga pacifica TaxID=1330330 RepID=A0A0G2ZE96_9BACT|nr:16S rRNA (cytosine(1402)-N(4))-methyltransferase RsmH [Kosmotoga pacifica]AKI97879.1 16S rRNA methyltransferase [Kosmotoga pacifica]
MTLPREYHESHRSVMVHEALQYLLTRDDGVYVDCTLGEGGHTKAIIEATSARSTVIGLDVDAEVLALAERKLRDIQGNVRLFNVSYLDFDVVLGSLGINRVDGFLLDLGVSTYQLKARGRGFSYEVDEPLDMRMNLSNPVKAVDIVNKYSERELAKVIFEYGDEKRFSRRIARSIVKRRPIQTTFELVEAIRAALPPEERHKRKRHFATRTFQALRIEVNKELEVIRNTLEKIPGYLNPGGRVVVITFHSLEDRTVKHAFREKKGIELKILTKKPVVPSEEEVRENPRARSAKLRAAERI